MANFLTLSFLLLCATTTSEQLMVDRIVAIVEDEIITMRDLIKNLPPSVDPNNIEPMLKEVLDQKIEDTLLEKEAKSLGEQLQVSENDVDKAIQEIMNINHLTETQLKEALSHQGVTWKEYRRQIRVQIERMRLIQYKIGSRIAISKQAVLAACEAQTGTSQVTAVELAHILVKADELSSHDELMAAQNKALKIYDELHNGLTWEEACTRYSSDTGNSDGRLGSFKRGQIFEEVEQVAFQMEEGEFSAPVRTPLGYHIIKVLKREVDSAARCQDEDFLSQIQNKLYQEEHERQQEAFIDSLKRKAFIEIRPLI